MSPARHPPSPPLGCGVMLATFLPFGPFRFPASSRAASLAPSRLRAVWHSPQWPRCSVKHHGEDAAIEDAIRADAMLEKGDRLDGGP